MLEIEPIYQPFRPRAIDDLKGASLAIVCRDFSLGDVEPPTVQVQRPLGKPLAHDGARRQVFELNQARNILSSGRSGTYDHIFTSGTKFWSDFGGRT